MSDKDAKIKSNQNAETNLFIFGLKPASNQYANSGVDISFTICLQYWQTGRSAPIWADKGRTKYLRIWYNISDTSPNRPIFETM